MTRDPEPAEELVRADFDQPNIARMYDYHLDGSANFAVDREAADALERAWPDARAYAQINRAFLGRAVHTLVAEYGIDQFLDLGAGVPTVGNVHEIAHRCNPDVRVAYVDWEAIAVHYGRRLLGSGEVRVSVTQADVRDPNAVLFAPGVAGLLDFTRPIAVLMVALADILDCSDPVPLIQTYRQACASGSALVVSNAANLAMNRTEDGETAQIFTTTTTPQIHRRDRDQVAALLSGYDLLEPGVVPSATWRPDEPVTEACAARSNAYAAVGILP